jgi:Highly conserved protein containing a thioredoxin domain
MEGRETNGNYKPTCPISGSYIPPRYMGIPPETVNERHPYGRSPYLLLQNWQPWTAESFITSQNNFKVFGG